MVAVLYFTSFDSLAYCFVGFSPPHSTKKILIPYQNLLTREFKIRVVRCVFKKLLTYFLEATLGVMALLFVKDASCMSISRFVYQFLSSFN